MYVEAVAGGFVSVSVWETGESQMCVLAFASMIHLTNRSTPDQGRAPQSIPAVLRVFACHEA
jgi:hypothetical protein